jgi:hypothetical protein
MPEGEGSEQQQRYCTNCGAEIRPGTSFCVSCGTPLTAGAQEPPPPHPEPPPSEGASPFDNLLLRVRRILNRARNGFAGVGNDFGRGSSGSALEWVRQLSTIPKLLVVGLVVGLVLLVLLVWLVLVAVLSPVTGIVCGGLFGVSIIALIIRVAQRRSVRNWAIVAVASVVLMVTFGGISDFVYGGGPSGSSSDNFGGSGGDGAGYASSLPIRLR